MKNQGIMDGCLECIGLPRLPAAPVPAHLHALGQTRLPDGSTARSFVCVTCGILWTHQRDAGWQRAPTQGLVETGRAQGAARFADSI